jgi:NAD(P)H dehydrogenase (quinone)
MDANPVKILVLYDSLTGKVEQMAKFVAEGASGIQGVEVRTRKIDGEGELKATPEDVLWADGVAVGSPTNM